MPSFLSQPQILAFLHTVVWLGSWLLLVAIVFMPFEQLFAVKRRKLFSKTLLSDIGYYFISGLVPSLLFTPPLLLIAQGAHAVVPAGIYAAIAGWPLWVRVLATLFVGEIGFYWGHRWAHEIPFLWRFHSVHHNPKEIYFLISARAHPFDNAFIRLCGLVPITVLGIATPLTRDGGMVSALLVLVLTMWGFLIHANLRWRFGPLEWLVATPAFHHWHHTLGEPRDRNYASMLPCMDWIFGTFYLPRKEWPVSYGIDTNMPASLGGQLIYPLLPHPPHPPLAQASLPPAAAES